MLFPLATFHLSTIIYHLVTQAVFKEDYKIPSRRYVLYFRLATKNRLLPLFYTLFEVYLD
jgi:hypothetical protein